MEKVRVLWSGLTGRTGREAISEVRKMDDIEIVGGVTRRLTGAMDFDLGVGCSKWYCYDDIANPLKARPEGFDVIVDFSHPDCFEQVVELAVRTHVPLISGTSGLSNRQMVMLYDAASRIPVFRGGNFRFKVKVFIDKVVENAKNGCICDLFENFYQGKSLPSETSKVIRNRIYEATGRTIEVYSSSTLPKKDLVCEWRVGSEYCRTEGFSELAHDVLRIAAIMPKIPCSPGHLWSLDEIWYGLRV